MSRPTTREDRLTRAIKEKMDEWDFRGSMSGMRRRNFTENECRALAKIALKVE